MHKVLNTIIRGRHKIDSNILMSVSRIFKKFAIGNNDSDQKIIAFRP
jgi:hypothetical protein